MLNPYLEQRLFTRSTWPVILEMEPGAFPDVLGRLPELTLPSFLPEALIRLTIPFFNMIALSAVPAPFLAVLLALPGVKMVHPDLEKYTLVMPAAARESEWWNTWESRKVLGADLAFLEGFNASRVRLGVLDTGVDVTHPQLSGTEFYSTISPTHEVIDENGHGSHVASTAAGKLAYSERGQTVEGVSRARMFSVKTLGRGIGTGFTSEVVNAMYLAYEKGARVISMSLGSEDCPGGCEV